MWKKKISQLYLCCFLRTSIKCEYVNVVGGCMYVKYLWERMFSSRSIMLMLFMPFVSQAGKKKVTEEYREIKKYYK